MESRNSVFPSVNATSVQLSETYPGDPNSKQATDDPDLRQRTTISLLCYTVLLFSAIVFVITYAILWTSLYPLLDLNETGNQWTFLVLFVSCTVIFITTSVLTLLIKVKKYSLTRKQIIFFDTILLLSWASPTVCIYFGAIEDRSHNRKDSAALVRTTFGEYIFRVCANGTTSQIYEDNVTSTVTTGTGSLLDSVKCEAARRLRTAIWCMYAWCAEVFLVNTVHTRLGIGFKPFTGFYKLK